MIKILDRNFKVIDILRGVTYSQYKRQARDFGTFQINVQVRKDNVYLFDGKKYYVLFDDSVLGIISALKYDDDYEFEKTIVITGRLATFILSKRVINGVVGLWGNTSFNIIKTLIMHCLINVEQERKINCVLNYDFEAQNENTKTQVSGGTLWENISDVLEQEKWGVELLPVYNVDGTESNISYFNLNLLYGKDRTATNTEGNKPVILSDRLSNIGSKSYVVSEEEYNNFAYIAGAGDEEYQRLWTTYDAEKKTGFERYEMYVDARDIESTEKQTQTRIEIETEQELVETVDEETGIKTYELVKKEIPKEVTEEVDVPINPYIYYGYLAQRGKETLLGYQKSTEYSASIAKNAKYKFGVDYDLCDIITIRDTELGVEVQAQVVEYTKSEQAGETIEEITIEYGTFRKAINVRQNFNSLWDNVRNMLRFWNMGFKGWQ